MIYKYVIYIRIYIFIHFKNFFIYIGVGESVPLGCSWAHLCHGIYVGVRGQLVRVGSFLVSFGDRSSGLLANILIHRAISIAMLLLVVGDGLF